MKRPLIIAFVLVAFVAVAQTISYFNQGFLRQGTAQLDRNYLGIYGSNIFYWGTNTPWTNNNYVLRSGDIMSGVLSNQSDLIVIRGTNDVATLQLEVPNIYFPPTFTGVTLQFNTNSVFYISSVSNQFKGDTYGKSWWGNGFGLTNLNGTNLVGLITNNTTGNAATASVATNVPATGITISGSGTSLVITQGHSVAVTLSNDFTVGWNTARKIILQGNSTSDEITMTPNSIYMDSSTDVAIDLDRGANNRNCRVSFSTAGSPEWTLGMPDSDGTYNAKSFGIGMVNNAITAGLIVFALDTNKNAYVTGNLTATNGIIQTTYSTNGVTVCTTNRQFYLLSGTNELVTLVNAANVPRVIYRFSSTNQNGSFIVTNATGTQTIRDGSALSYTNFGVGEIGFISDGAHWWLASKGKTIFPNASWSTSTNTTFPNITNTITLQTTDHGGSSQGIGLDNSAWWTAGVGSRIWITNSGDYMLSFSAVWAKGAGSPSNGDIWLRKNGTDVPNTATIMTIQQNATNVMTVNLFLTITAPAYFDLQGASTDGNGLLQALPAITSPFNRPAMPSIIVTVNKISD